MTDVPKRPWDETVSVGLRYIVDYQLAAGSWAPSLAGEPIVLAPDEEHLFFVTRRGDLGCDCNAYHLQVFSVGDLRRALTAPAPRETTPISARYSIILKSGTNAPAISAARWTDGGATLTFVGTLSEGRRAVQRLVIRSGELETLSDPAHDVTAFDLRGDSLVYMAVTGTRSRHPILNEYPVVPVGSDNLASLFGSQTEPVISVVGVYKGRRVAQMPMAPGPAGGPWFSPDGKYAVVMFPPGDAPVPRSWSAYETRRGAAADRSEWNRGDLPPDRFPSFVLVDLEHGRIRKLLDAPTGAATAVGASSEGNYNAQRIRPIALWAADSRHVVLVNPALPLSDGADERRRMAYIVDYDVSSGSWTVIEPLADSTDEKPVRRVRAVGWLVHGQRLLVTHENADGKRSAGMAYQLSGHRWVGEPVSSSVDVPLSRREKASQRAHKRGPVRLPGGGVISIREDANHPPEIVATEGVHEAVLLGPDASLRGVQRARVETVTWKDPDGRTASGGLMLPANAGDTPPKLVIQAYHYIPERFLPDGKYPTAYAAQSLVSAGFAVLQIDIPAVDRPHLAAHIEEGPYFVARVQSALDMLAHRGLVDPDGIGLVGFSRGAYMVYYAITHPGRLRIGAAVVADGVTYSYGEYLRAASGSSIQASAIPEYERQFGRGNFWQNKASWLEHSPGFNVDRVEAPALFMVNAGGEPPLSAFEIVGAFRLNGRKLEYLVFPQGAHQLQRPRERLASLQSTRDWMAFWLQGRELGGVEHANRHARWRELRAREEQRRAESTRSANETLRGPVEQGTTVAN